MSAADQIRALAVRLSEDMENYERQPFDVPRDGTCDACAQTALLAAAWVTYDGQEEPWLCVTCDRIAQDEKSARDALSALADLIDAIDRAEAGADTWGTCGHEWVQVRYLTAARDALLASLGVTQ